MKKKKKKNNPSNSVNCIIDASNGDKKYKSYTQITVTTRQLSFVAQFY